MHVSMCCCGSSTDQHPVKGPSSEPIIAQYSLVLKLVLELSCCVSTQCADREPSRQLSPNA